MEIDGAVTLSSLEITPEILALISEIDEFKGAWQAIGRLTSDRLSAVRRVATIGSIGDYRFSVPARVLKEGSNDIPLTYSKTPRQADPMARGRNTVLALHSITPTPRTEE